MTRYPPPESTRYPLCHGQVIMWLKGSLCSAVQSRHCGGPLRCKGTGAVEEADSFAFSTRGLSALIILFRYIRTPVWRI